MPVIPGMMEAKVGESWSKAGPVKSDRCYLKNDLNTKKGWRHD
jgi:hypothetical protein